MLLLLSLAIIIHTIIHAEYCFKFQLHRQTRCLTITKSFVCANTRWKCLDGALRVVMTSSFCRPVPGKPTWPSRSCWITWPKNTKKEVGHPLLYPPFTLLIKGRIQEFSQLTRKPSTNSYPLGNLRLLTEQKIFPLWRLCDENRCDFFIYLLPDRNKYWRQISWLLPRRL